MIYCTCTATETVALDGGSYNHLLMRRVALLVLCCVVCCVVCHMSISSANRHHDVLCYMLCRPLWCGVLCRALLCLRQGKVSTAMLSFPKPLFVLTGAHSNSIQQHSKHDKAACWCQLLCNGLKSSSSSSVSSILLTVQSFNCISHTLTTAPLSLFHCMQARARR